MKKYLTALLLLTTMLMFTACPRQTEPTQTSASETSVTAVTSHPNSISDATFDDALLLTASVWDGENAYITLHNNVPYFLTADFFSYDNNELKMNCNYEYYQDLDYYGRCGMCYAMVCTDIMPTEPRGDIGMVKPTGWHTIRYDNLISDKYLYNRCHLIGYQLAGENANTKNLITGTRYLNVTGMLPFENAVDDYIEANPTNHVFYRVTPVFIGEDLVAQGVIMEAYSVEDNGTGVQFCVFCPNVQPGITIDYATGESWENEQTKESYWDDHPTDYAYVLNENSKKIHRPDCSAVESIDPKNRTNTTRSYDELIAQGYSPCGICHPS